MWRRASSSQDWGVLRDSMSPQFWEARFVVPMSPYFEEHEKLRLFYFVREEEARRKECYLVQSLELILVSFSTIDPSSSIDDRASPTIVLHSVFVLF